jgi:hypothetical protein
MVFNEYREFFLTFLQCCLFSDEAAAIYGSFSASKYSPRCLKYTPTNLLRDSQCVGIRGMSLWKQRAELEQRLLSCSCFDVTQTFFESLQ